MKTKQTQVSGSVLLQKRHDPSVFKMYDKKSTEPPVAVNIISVLLL